MMSLNASVYSVQLNHSRKLADHLNGGSAMKGLLAIAVCIIGGCGAINGYTTNEMLFVIVMILAMCLVWQISIVLWQCRVRRKRTEAILKARRYADGKLR
jgi:uncharacterized membrane protein YdbT with pleckstrin-like domain